jgi:tetratricopeptide (TPR) repeat protein
MSAYVYGSGMSYKAYLQAKSFVDDIRWDISEVNLNVSASKEALEQQGFRIEQAVERSGAAVANRLDRVGDALSAGFLTIHANLGEIRTDLRSIEGRINEFSAKFDWGIARLEAAIGGVQDSLQELIRLAKNPEHTWAWEQFAIAWDAFNRNLYPESLEYVERAINGHQGHTGYRLEHRFHDLLAWIRRGDYQNAGDLMDLPKAEEAYLNSARYAGATHRLGAARSLLGAGWVAYCQGKIAEAQSHTERALGFAEFGELNYQLAKILMHRHAVEPALGYLAKALRSDSLYAPRCFADGDFLAHEQDVRQVVKRERDVALECCREFSKATRDMIGLVEVHLRLLEDNIASTFPRVSREMPSIVRDEMQRVGGLADRVGKLPRDTQFVDAFIAPRQCYQGIRGLMDARVRYSASIQAGIYSEVKSELKRAGKQTDSSGYDAGMVLEIQLVMLGRKDLKKLEEKLKEAGETFAKNFKALLGKYPRLVDMWSAALDHG